LKFEEARRPREAPASQIRISPCACRSGPGAAKLARFPVQVCLAGGVRTTSAGFGAVLAIFGGFLALSAVISFAVSRIDGCDRS